MNNVSNSELKIEESKSEVINESQIKKNVSFL